MFRDKISVWNQNRFNSDIIQKQAMKCIIILNNLNKEH